MTDYNLMNRQLQALISDTFWDVSDLANASALIWESLENINWAGFYIMKNGELLLGPFQGKTACTVIAAGKGVCGTAVLEDAVQLVPDVHLFPGHIACDAASNSEIVIPIHRKGEIYGVLDIDSPIKGRFTEEDSEGLRMLVRTLERKLEGIDTGICWTATI